LLELSIFVLARYEIRVLNIRIIGNLLTLESVRVSENRLGNYWDKLDILLDYWGLNSLYKVNCTTYASHIVRDWDIGHSFLAFSTHAVFLLRTHSGFLSVADSFAVVTFEER